MLGALQRGCAGGRIGAVPDTRDDLSTRGAPAALLVPFPQKEGERGAVWLLELSGEPWALRVLRLPAGWVSLGLGALPLFLDPWCGARGGAGLCLAVASSSGVEEPAGHLGAVGHLPCGAAGWRVPWWGQYDGVGCGVVLYLQGLLQLFSCSQVWPSPKSVKREEFISNLLFPILFQPLSCHRSARHQGWHHPGACQGAALGPYFGL